MIYLAIFRQEPEPSNSQLHQIAAARASVSAKANPDNPGLIVCFTADFKVSEPWSWYGLIDNGVLIRAKKLENEVRPFPGTETLHYELRMRIDE